MPSNSGDAGDSESLTNDVERTDFGSMFVDILKNSNIKIIFLVFIMYLLLESDVFIEKILSKISNTTDGRHKTSKGTIVSALLFTLLFVMFNVLITCEIL